MLEIYTLTEETIPEVSKICGRSEADLRSLLIDPTTMRPFTRPIKLYIDRPDSVEGFMTGQR